MAQFFFFMENSGLTGLYLKVFLEARRVVCHDILDVDDCNCRLVCSLRAQPMCAAYVRSLRAQPT